jgi:pimeloyl-ACP methyl ester carboxylesterase
MITDKADTRQLISLNVNGTVLRGTYHQPAATQDPEDRELGEKIAVLFMNSLSSTRSLIGDAGVYWAEAFAAEGYPCYRIDLPGLGDSDGDRPNDLLRFTNEGGYANAAASVVKQLVQSRGLLGIVIFGHCAGATTAIYAASLAKECKGLILVEPYFSLPKVLTSSLRPELVNWARDSRIGSFVRNVYDRIRELPRAIGKGNLPRNANFALIARCKRVLASGLPVMILTAAQPPMAGRTAPKTGAFDYLKYIRGLSTRNGQFTVNTIAETDHSFANLAGRLAVRHSVQSWLSRSFTNVPDPELPLEAEGRHGQEANTVARGAAVSVKVLSGGVSGYGNQ